MKYSTYNYLSKIEKIDKIFTILVIINTIYSLFLYNNIDYIKNPKILSFVVQTVQNEESHVYAETSHIKYITNEKRLVVEFEYLDGDIIVREQNSYDISVLDDYKKTKCLPSMKNDVLYPHLYASLAVTFFLIIIGYGLSFIEEDNIEIYAILTAVVCVLILFYIGISFDHIKNFV